MKQANLGPGSRFVMWTGRPSGSLWALKYLAWTLLIASAFASIAYAIALVVAALGTWLGVARWWTGETHFEAANGRLLVHRGTRRLRGRAVRFSLYVPVALEGTGSHGNYRLSLRQDRRRIALGDADDLVPHEYVRWSRWLHTVGGSVDMRWQLPEHLHVNEVPIALDVAARCQFLPLPTSLNAPLETSVPSTEAARRREDAGTAVAAAESAASSWKVLPLGKRSRQPLVLVGEAQQGAPLISFATPSDRVWLRRGPFVIELRLSSLVDGVAVSYARGWDSLYFTPARPDRDSPQPTAESGR